MTLAHMEHQFSLDVMLMPADKWVSTFKHNDGWYKVAYSFTDSFRLTELRLK